MDVDLEELAAIIEQLDKTEFTEFLYEQGTLRVHVRRGGYFPDAATQANGHAAAASPPPAAAPASGAAAAPTPTPAAAPPAASAPATAGPATGSNGQSDGISPDNLPAGHTLVTAPMLGTFYGAPKPGEPAFVQVGDSVAADSVLCIVEVMKLMNSVAAGAEGEIAAVFVQDGELVEFEQPLFAIRAAS